VTEYTALDYDPFDGDFGDSGDHLFQDKMVRAKKEHKCSHCLGPIVAGETYRSRREVSWSEFFCFKWCAACCEAMVFELKAESLGEEEEIFPFESRRNLNNKAEITESSRSESA